MSGLRLFLLAFASTRGTQGAAVPVSTLAIRKDPSALPLCQPDRQSMSPMAGAQLNPQVLIHNNLGGQGPNLNDPHMILIGNFAYHPITGNELRLRVTNRTQYTAASSSNNRITAGLLNINVKAPGQGLIGQTASVRLLFQVVDAATGQDITDPQLFGIFSMYDLDTANANAARECVTFESGVSRSELYAVDTSELTYEQLAHDHFRICGTREGNGADNPTSQMNLNPLHKQRLVQFVNRADFGHLEAVVAVDCCSTGGRNLLISANFNMPRCSSLVPTTSPSPSPPPSSGAGGGGTGSGSGGGGGSGGAGGGADGGGGTHTPPSFPAPSDPPSSPSPYQCSDHKLLQNHFELGVAPLVVLPLDADGYPSTCCAACDQNSNCCGFLLNTTACELRTLGTCATFNRQRRRRMLLEENEVLGYLKIQASPSPPPPSADGVTTSGGTVSSISSANGGIGGNIAASDASPNEPLGTTEAANAGLTASEIPSWQIVLYVLIALLLSCCLIACFWWKMRKKKKRSDAINSTPIPSLHLEKVSQPSIDVPFSPVSPGKPDKQAAEPGGIQESHVTAPGEVGHGNVAVLNTAEQTHVLDESVTHAGTDESDSGPAIAATDSRLDEALGDSPAAAPAAEAVNIPAASNWRLQRGRSGETGCLLPGLTPRTLSKKSVSAVSKPDITVEEAEELLQRAEEEAAIANERALQTSEEAEAAMHAVMSVLDQEEAIATAMQDPERLANVKRIRRLSASRKAEHEPTEVAELHPVELQNSFDPDSAHVTLPEHRWNRTLSVTRSFPEVCAEQQKLAEVAAEAAANAAAAAAAAEAARQRMREARTRRLRSQGASASSFMAGAYAITPRPAKPHSPRRAGSDDPRDVALSSIEAQVDVAMKEDTSPVSTP